MKQVDFKGLSRDDLWALHVEVLGILEQRIKQEKSQLEERLRLLGVRESGRRPYPRVLPKYRNPDHPTETWTGRGRQPGWLAAQLKAGRRLDDFRIPPLGKVEVRK
jgi:DNA-binding protein H-NS